MIDVSEIFFKGSYISVKAKTLNRLMVYTLMLDQCSCLFYSMVTIELNTKQVRTSLKTIHLSLSDSLTSSSSSSSSDSSSESRSASPSSSSESTSSPSSGSSSPSSLSSSSSSSSASLSTRTLV